MQPSKPATTPAKSSRTLVTPSGGIRGGEQPVWHAREISDALHDLETNSGGLTAGEAETRLARYGPNALPAAAGKSVLQRLLTQFDNLLIFVLARKETI